MSEQVSTLVFLEYLTTVFDNIRDAVLLIGIEPRNVYRLLLANAAYFAASGHSKKDFGKELADIVHPETYKKLDEQYKKVIAEKKPIEIVDWYEVPLGRQAFEVKLIPILNAVGEVIQIAAITRNVTELFQLREQVQEAAHVLENATKQLRTAKP